MSVADERLKTSQPTANGADILVDALIRQGVDVVFAYPGGASMPIHQSLTKRSDELRTILPRHEQGGSFAAEGYARSSGRVGVCLATSGPGATNLVTGLADAKLDSCPVVAITGQVPTGVIGTDAFQETPIVEVCRAITKHHFLVTDVNDLPRVVKEAFYIATTGRPGPVLIDVPKNIQIAIPDEELDFDPPTHLPGYRPHDRAVVPEQIRQVLAAIRRSKQPILYVGGGAIHSGASEELLKFAERTKIPVTMTLMGLGAFPGTHEQSLQMLGMHGTEYANHAVSQADLLLAFGVRFDDRVTGKLEEFAKHGKIVHVEIDPSEIHKNKEAHIPIIADLKETLVALNEAMTDDDLPEIDAWRKRCADWKKNLPLKYKDAGDLILPQYAIEELWKQTHNDDLYVAVGVGQHQMWAAQYYKFDQPRRWMSSSGLGSMGFGLPAAMGAQVVHPDKTVIDIEGDGSFQMNIQELATLYCEKLPVKILLLNNQHLGMVMQWEDRFHAGNRAHTYLGPIDHPEAVGQGTSELPDTSYPDFVTIARGYGLQARHVRSKAEFPAALAEMLAAEGPYLLDVLCPYQEHVLPMIPTGQSVQNMITE